MINVKDRNLLVDVAVMYYLENKTQSEISKELYISRPTVSRLLKKARDMNIVDIRINYESDEINRIKKQLKHRFNIENVIVVKSLKTEKNTIKEIGKAAANELNYILEDNLKIGMSWGRTVKAMVDAYKPKQFNNIKVIELFGAVEYTKHSEEFLSTGYDFSRKIGGIFFPLPSPLYIKDKSVRDSLVKSPIVGKTLDMIEESDLIISSIGIVNSTSPQRIWDAHVDDETKKELVNMGAVGYFCAHFFDYDGNFICHPINENIVGIKTETIKNKKIMLVAGGLQKAKAIHAILKSGNISILVSDDLTLKKVLEEAVNGVEIR
jgi:DNA-binding transcriptional regulator LsrR (DeoR family)